MQFEAKGASVNVENEKPISSDGSVQNFLKDPNFISMAKHLRVI